MQHPASREKHVKALAPALLAVLFVVTAVHAGDLSVDNAKDTRAAMATAQAGEVLHPPLPRPSPDRSAVRTVLDAAETGGIIVSSVWIPAFGEGRHGWVVPQPAPNSPPGHLCQWKRR